MNTQTQQNPKLSAKRRQTKKDVEKQFNLLAEKWYLETLNSSGYLDKVLHPAYQRIIGLGKSVIPFILNELKDQPVEWFWALRALTGEDPTTATMQGKKDEIAKAWLNWGKKNGYIQMASIIAKILDQAAEERIKQVFENLKDGEFELTSPFDAKYNCIAHAAGESDKW